MAKHHAPPPAAKPVANPSLGATPPPGAPAPGAPPPGVKAKSQAIPALAIHALPERGFWRADRHWTPEVQVVALSEFTEDQVAALRAEPLIVVEDVEITPPIEPEPEA